MGLKSSRIDDSELAGPWEQIEDQYAGLRPQVLTAGRHLASRREEAEQPC